MKTPSTLLWKILILVLMLILADLQMFRSAAYVPLALEIRAPTSVIESPSVVSLLPIDTQSGTSSIIVPPSVMGSFVFTLFFILFVLGLVIFRPNISAVFARRLVFFSARHGVCVIAWLYHQQI